MPILVILVLTALGILLSCGKTDIQTTSMIDGNVELNTHAKETIATAQTNITEDKDSCEVPQSAKETIENFLKDYHNAEAALETADLTTYFSMEDSYSYENAMINQVSLDLLIETRSMQIQDLRMTESASTVQYVSCEEEDGFLTVTILEDQQVQFACLDEESQTSGIEHTFVLSKSNGDYQIVKHERSEDLFLLVEEEYERQISYSDPSMEEIDETMDQVMQTLLQESEDNISELLEERQEYLTSPEEFDVQRLSCDVEFDREAAVAYALQWWNDRNEEWMEYDEIGGNCNNFISQCLYAAGIPMDYEGESTVQWKWYSDDINLSESDWGRVPSWTGVNAFYDYCGLNEGSGLSGWVNENVFSAQPGDIIQFGAADEWRHSVIVTDRIYDEAGEVVDFLIASNTTDRVNYPLSAYGYTGVRLLRIYGYNE